MISATEISNFYGREMVDLGSFLIRDLKLVQAFMVIYLTIARDYQVFKWDWTHS